MRLKIFIIFILLSAFAPSLHAQNFTYAEVTDIHVGRESGEEAAIATVNDINKNPDIKFVLITGDLTNNGAYEQMDKVKGILDKLNKPYYIIPGNHEDVWSSSGGTYFSQLFKHDRFRFEAGGYFFIGTDCGPMLKHGMSHLPQDNLNWLDSTLNARKDKNQPVIFANHYPMNELMDNSNEALKILKKYNIQLILCGHGHTNRKYNFNGIPGIMCRTNLVVKGKSGYNIVQVKDNTFSFSVRYPATDSLDKPWASVALKPIPKESITPAEPDYSVNEKYKNVSTKWQFNNPLGICGGFAIAGNTIYTGTYDGDLVALNLATGKKLWSYRAGGRIFSTPAVGKNLIVFTSTNGSVYCVNTVGKLQWQFKSARAVVSSAVINNNRVFIGFSDHSFRCFDLTTGRVIWDFNQLKSGFVEEATLYNGNVYFGAWNSHLYALSQVDGKLLWQWTNNAAAGYSPAFLAPVATHNRIFAVTPDYYVTCLDAAAGKEIWRETKPEVPVWFSRGLSKDSALLYVKTRNNKGYGIATMGDQMKTTWEAPLNIDDDASITPIENDGKLVYFSSNIGSIIAVDQVTGKTIWEHKLANTAINLVKVIGTEVYASTVDGKLVCLSIK